MLMLMIAAFVIGLFQWPVFITVAIAAGVMVVLGALQDVWYGLTSNRHDAWF